MTPEQRALLIERYNRLAPASTIVVQNGQDWTWKFAQTINQHAKEIDAQRTLLGIILEAISDGTITRKNSER